MVNNLDSFDVKALEQSVNDSAVRVSTIWVSFLVFGLYLVVAAGGVTHRQLMLEDPVKLPILNVDLPLVGFFFLAPVLFVILHAYVLVQVLLLARTAAAYNEAIERNIPVATDRARVRQRLANTLFAQMFAGSPREQKGLLGALLRLAAWTTLAIAPVLVLLTFEVKFLPYHSSLVMWGLRALIVLDLAGVLLLWRGALDAQQEITWRGLIDQRAALLTALFLVLFAVVAVTFPGEFHTRWMRPNTFYSTMCNRPVLGIFTDRLFMTREVLIETEKLAKIEVATKAAGQRASEGERTRHFEGRDLSCGSFVGADLRRVDFSGANLRGANLMSAQLQGATLAHAQLTRANLDRVQLQGADLTEAQLQLASLVEAQLQGADLTAALIQGAQLNSAQLEGADVRSVRLVGANLGGAHLQGANFTGAQLMGARLNGAQLQGADLSMAFLEGADLSDAQLQGVHVGILINTSGFFASLDLTNLSRASVWRTSGMDIMGMMCGNAQVTTPQFRKVVRTRPDSGEAQLESTPADVQTFIQDTVRNVPEPARRMLQATLHARLVTEANDEAANEQVWRACAAKALIADEYGRKHANYLINLACNSDEYVAVAIFHQWVLTESYGHIATLARGLLGLDGKPCPGAKELSKYMKESLRALMGVKAAD